MGKISLRENGNEEPKYQSKKVIFFRNFIAYTLYLSEDIIDNVFDDFDKEKGNVDEAKRYRALVK